MLFLIVVLKFLLIVLFTVRFLTDPNQVGFGKIGATDVPPEYLEKPYTELPALEPYGLWACLSTSFSMGAKSTFCLS